MTVLELIIYLLKNAPLDAKVYIYCADEEYHHEDYTEDDIGISFTEDEVGIYL